MISYCQRISADVHALATFAAKAAPDDLWTTFFFCMRNPLDYFSSELRGYHFILSKVKELLQILLFLLKVLKRT